MILSLIAAYAKDSEGRRVIGKDNHIPWRSDLHRFREYTAGNAVVMGRKTYESIGRVLPNRENIILTRQEDYKVPGAYVFTDLNVALRFAGVRNHEVFVIGGQELYEQTIGKADRLYLTKFRIDSVEGDAFFPEFLHGNFKSIYHEEGEVETFNIFQRVSSGEEEITLIDARSYHLGYAEDLSVDEDVEIIV
jgi:dihydrofolate reductase